ncbi:Uu.00g085480.m01.CDS01 [Anthostomella pinea]|uniref:Uu.00g085480.m01.CDS01 n=1 Tax=Anthostomella pinea TaxID=933095 RepID=A0AAI8VML7_9PEZI|nr:Uu.00g085480.m01.CDS01 [Anthostomella pinea]
MLKSNPNTVLGLLYNRTRYSMEQWAHFDCSKLHLSWEMGFCDVNFCSLCVVMDGPEYGKTVPFDAATIHRGHVLGYPLALCVLEAQAHLMKFLHRLVDVILDGVDPEKESPCDKFMNAGKLGFKVTGDVALWSTYVYGPYPAPPIFDAENLVARANMGLEAVEDQLVLLQTDQAYLRRFSEIVKEGGVFKLFSSVSTPSHEAYGIIAAEILREVENYLQWRLVKEECEYVHELFQRLHELYNRLGVNTHRNAHLHLRREFDYALGRLDYLLYHDVEFYEESVRKGIPLVNIVSKGDLDAPDMFPKDPLQWCMTQMSGGPDDERRFDYADLFGFLDDHLRNASAAEKARLDSIHLACLSDLAATHQLLMNAIASNGSGGITPAKQMKFFVGRSFNVDNIYAVLALRRLEAPETPNVKSLQAQLEQSDAHRQDSKVFWDGVRQVWQTKTKRCFPRDTDDEIREFLSVLHADSSPEYLTAVEAERASIIATIAKHAAVADRSIAQRQVNHRKGKVKTRPADAGSPPTTPIVNESRKEASDGAGLGDHTAEEISSPITLSRRANDIFTNMYPSTGEEAAKGVQWDQFVCVMGDAGFSARNAGGSVVAFENEAYLARGKAGRIAFHRPHTEPKVNPVMLKAMGKRMAKRFGWSRERFTLAT